MLVKNNETRKQMKLLISEAQKGYRKANGNQIVEAYDVRTRLNKEP